MCVRAETTSNETIQTDSIYVFRRKKYMRSIWKKKERGETTRSFVRPTILISNGIGVFLPKNLSFRGGFKKIRIELNWTQSRVSRPDPQLESSFFEPDSLPKSRRPKERSVLRLCRMFSASIQSRPISRFNFRADTTREWFKFRSNSRNQPWIDTQNGWNALRFCRAFSTIVLRLRNRCIRVKCSPRVSLPSHGNITHSIRSTVSELSAFLFRAFYP